VGCRHEGKVRSGKLGGRKRTGVTTINKFSCPVNKSDVSPHAAILRTLVREGKKEPGKKYELSLTKEAHRGALGYLEILASVGGATALRGKEVSKRA